MCLACLVIPPQVFTFTVHADGKINPIWIWLVLAACTKPDIVQF